MRRKLPRAHSLIADDKLYWYNATTRDEALYLTAILNAESLQDSWRESKTSNLHFDLNPLKHVPVPLFNSGSDAHVRIAQLATEAEQDPGADRSEMEGIIDDLLPGWGWNTVSPRSSFRPEVVCYTYSADATLDRHRWIHSYPPITYVTSLTFDTLA